MATWKKVIVSGSDAILNQLNIGNNQITTNPATTVLTGSFSGSFFGTTNLPDLTESTGIVPFIYDGGTTATIAVSGAAQLANNIITKWNTTDGKFVDSSLTDNGTTITGATSIQLTGANSVLTGSFSGSFTGTTNLPDLTQSTGITAFTYDGSTTATISVSGASTLNANRITKWTGTAFTDTNITDTGTQIQILPSATNGLLISSGGLDATGDSVFQNNLIIQGDLTVAGTASFNNQTSLLIADRFALLASGSSTLTDGGIIVSTNLGYSGSAWYLEATNTGNYGRWAVASNVQADASSVTADEYAVTAKLDATNAPNDGVPPTWGGSTNGKGNIWIKEDTGDIYIWA